MKSLTRNIILTSCTAAILSACGISQLDPIVGPKTEKKSSAPSNGNGHTAPSTGSGGHSTGGGNCDLNYGELFNTPRVAAKVQMFLEPASGSGSPLPEMSYPAAAAPPKGVRDQLVTSSKCLLLEGSDAGSYFKVSRAPYSSTFIIEGKNVATRCSDWDLLRFQGGHEARGTGTDCLGAESQYKGLLLYVKGSLGGELPTIQYAIKVTPI